MTNLNQGSPVAARGGVERLAEIVLDIPAAAISSDALAAARWCLLDTVGAAMAGACTPAASAMRTWILRAHAGGRASVWFSGARRTAAAAAMGNAASASALDVDDGHRAAAGHPGASIVPVAVAVAEEVGATRTELLIAIVIGYEIAIRVSAARRFAGLAVDAFMTGHWSGYGCVAAAGWLRRLGGEELTAAFAVAGALRPTIIAGAATNQNGIKEAIPWATFGGVSASDVAAAGMTGPTEILDGSDLTELLRPFTRPFYIESVYRKPYSCCQLFHSTLDAYLQVQAAHGLAPEEIVEFCAVTSGLGLAMGNETRPRSLEAAEFSLPFCLAVVAHDGPDGLLPLRSSQLDRADIMSLSGRIRLEVDPAFDAAFPKERPGRVVIKTRRGRFEFQVQHSLGVPENPLDGPALKAKFFKLAAGLIGPAERDELLEAILDSSSDLAGLFSALRRAPDGLQDHRGRLESSPIARARSGPAYSE